MARLQKKGPKCPLFGIDTPWCFQKAKPSTEVGEGGTIWHDTHEKQNQSTEIGEFGSPPPFLALNKKIKKPNSFGGLRKAPMDACTWCLWTLFGWIEMGLSFSRGPQNRGCFDFPFKPPRKDTQMETNANRPFSYPNRGHWICLNQKLINLLVPSTPLPCFCR